MSKEFKYKFFTQCLKSLKGISDISNKASYIDFPSENGLKFSLTYG